MPEGPTPASDHPLDTWILARLNQVTSALYGEPGRFGHAQRHTGHRRVPGRLEQLVYSPQPAALLKSTHDLDKHTAYATLYHVLVKLIKLLAPLTPFVTETMYQNLVRAVQPTAYDSVHHCDWPEVDTAASAEYPARPDGPDAPGHQSGPGGRSTVNLKVRQPLAKALVHVRDGQETLSEAFTAIVADELNVKALAFVADEATLLRFEVLPNSKFLGPRFGAQFPRVRAALSALDPAAVVHQVQAGLPVVVTVDGEDIELTPEEVLIRTHPAAGLAVATEKGVDRRRRYRRDASLAHGRAGA